MQPIYLFVEIKLIPLNFPIKRRIKGDFKKHPLTKFLFYYNKPFPDIEILSMQSTEIYPCWNFFAHIIEIPK